MKMDVVEPYFSFLPGTGEMATLTREFNWMNHAMGDPIRWPESLKTILYLMLTSPLPMMLLWGHDLICFYNDAYRPALGDSGKRPAILGQPAEKACMENWDVIKPLIDGALQGNSHYREDQLLPVYRNGKRQDTYWNLSYSPVPDDKGASAGVLVIGQETTGKITKLNETRDREQQLRFAIDAADLGTWDLNPFTNKFVGNDRLKKWFGLDPDEEIELPLALAKIHEKDRDLVVGAIQTALDPASGGVYDIEYRILNPKTGMERKVVAKGRALFNSEGVAYRFSGTLQDLTHEKLAYERLRENEERLNILIAASALGTWEWRLESDTISYSDRYLEIFGHPPDQKIPHGELLKQLLPEDRIIRDQALHTGLQTGSFHYQSRIKWMDQSVHWIEAEGTVFNDESMNPEKIIGTVRDITDEKNSQRELRESEQKFRLLADSMAQFVWTGDPGGTLNYFNRSVYDYSGLSPEDVAEKGWLQIVHPDEKERNRQEWALAVQTGNPFYFEHRFRRKDGVYRWQLSRAIPQRDAEGRIQMWVGTSTDIEDQKIFADQLEKQVLERTRELELKNTELEKMNAELESFTYISSHDLQEPLRKIQILSSIIIQKEFGSLTETAKDYIHRMQMAAKRMQALIEDLLTYSRTTDTQRSYELTPILPIVSDVIKELDENIAEKNAVIEIGPLCSLKIIPFQFRQMMHNLICNSLKFSRTGVTPHIVVDSDMIITGDEESGLQRNSRYCHIWVSDNGIGFEKQYEAKIFQVFQRLNAEGDHSGTGIGLAIVKKIVDNHGGMITATGNPGQGARFDIFIPENA